jgi:hypothetical protein
VYPADKVLHGALLLDRLLFSRAHRLFQSPLRQHTGIFFRRQEQAVLHGVLPCEGVWQDYLARVSGCIVSGCLAANQIALALQVSILFWQVPGPI